MIFIICSRH